MSFNRVYNHAYAIYALERLLRNFCVAAAMYHAIGHRNLLILSFFMVGLLLNLHPLLLLYVHRINHKHPQFKRYLQHQSLLIKQKLAKLEANRNDDIDDPSLHVSIDSQQYHHYKELKFIKLIH